MQSRQVEHLDGDLACLVRDLVDTLASVSYGRGLAAIQIGVPLRVFVTNMSGLGQDLRVFINPKIETLSGRATTRREGCLSLPDHKAGVTRRNKVVIRATDHRGHDFVHVARGYEAAVIQHELDHLDGIFYWDRNGTREGPLPT
jgi:peptide deformylase